MLRWVMIGSLLFCSSAEAADFELPEAAVIVAEGRDQKNCVERVYYSDSTTVLLSERKTQWLQKVIRYAIGQEDLILSSGKHLALGLPEKGLKVQKSEIDQLFLDKVFLAFAGTGISADLREFSRELEQLQKKAKKQSKKLAASKAVYFLNSELQSLAAVEEKLLQKIKIKFDVQSQEQNHCEEQ
ncbi:MAG: hypothetical protein JWQ35_791 [Bacteriovoracaceae bacterium]|nr:hypothetical protein [Bacteriovoracaceae bacterium]